MPLVPARTEIKNKNFLSWHGIKYKRYEFLINVYYDDCN